MDDKQKIKELESIIVELLSEIEDISPCGTECISEELLNKIDQLLPDND